MKKLFVSLSAVLVFSGLAMASITPALDGGSPTGPVAGIWTWTYRISVDANESLNPTVNASATCIGGQTPCNTFWTIYDVGGLQTGTENTPGGWGFVENSVGITPSGQLIADGGYLNVTFYYTAGTQTGPITAIDGFSFQSTTGNANPLGVYSYQATNIQNNSPDQGQGHLNLPATVPEPASVLLIGGGLVGLAFFRRKRSR